MVTKRGEKHVTVYAHIDGMDARVKVWEGRESIIRLDIEDIVIHMTRDQLDRIAVAISLFQQGVS